MQPIDNSQFTEEQRSEAFRLEVMQQLRLQTKALGTIRTIMVLFTVLFCIGVVAWLFVVAQSNPSGF
jgi:hypothetical protein